MIDKIKVTVATTILLILAILIGLYGLERSKNCSLRQEQARLLEKLRLNELRKRIADAPVIETKTLSAKNALNVRGTSVPTDVRAPSGAIPQDCRACFENYQYQVEVKDQDGNWIFQDDNIFDERPGNLTLTDKFWTEIEQSKPATAAPGTARPARLKNRVLIGFELDQYKIEYAYSPLGIQTNKLDLGLALYSSLAMSYASSPLEARAGIGLEIRF